MLLNSIVIPTYGRLKEDLFSMITELCNLGFQVVLVDDNPVGASVKKDLALRASKIKSEYFVYLDLDGNYGACVARNKGVERASGELITFMDDDDYFLLEEFMKKIHIAFQFFDEYDIFTSDMVVEWNNGYYLPEFSNFKGLTVEDFLLRGNCFTPMLTVRKSFFVSIGGFDIVRKHQDHVFFAKCLLKRARIKYVSVRTFVHVDHDMFRITNSNYSHVDDRLKYDEELYDFLPLKSEGFRCEYEKVKYSRLFYSEINRCKLVGVLALFFMRVFDLNRPVSALNLLKLVINRIFFGALYKNLKYRFAVKKYYV